MEIRFLNRGGLGPVEPNQVFFPPCAARTAGGSWFSPVAFYGGLLRETWEEDRSSLGIAKGVAIETDELALKNSYLPKFAKVLPAKKLTQYYQVENKLKAIIDYDLASAIPLVK